MRTDELIDALGGNGVVTKQLRLSDSVVSMWKLRDRLPAQQWLPLWCLALERGVPWTPPTPAAERLVQLLTAPLPAAGAEAGAPTDPTLREAA